MFGSIRRVAVWRRATTCSSVDVYLEGGDQFRGWFNSSLMCGLAAHDRSPYKNLITHVLAADGVNRCTNQPVPAVSPNEVVGNREVLLLRRRRLISPEDMRCSTIDSVASWTLIENLETLLCYALGNLDGFNPGYGCFQDVEIDRALAGIRRRNE